MMARAEASLRVFTCFKIAAVAQIPTRSVRFLNNGCLQVSTRIWHATHDHQLFKPSIQCVCTKGRKNASTALTRRQMVDMIPQRTRQTNRRLRPLSRNCLGA